VELIAIVLALMGLDVAAFRWGVDSREHFQSPEWLRRQLWIGPK
jgi:hypothetical protein